MAVRMTFITYKEEAISSMIKSNDSREATARAAIESAGGKFLGFYGCMGQDYDVVVISEMELTDYLSVIGTVMLGGACSDISTVSCYTGDEVTAAMAKTTGNVVQYQAPS